MTEQALERANEISWVITKYKKHLSKLRTEKVISRPLQIRLYSNSEFIAELLKEDSGELIFNLEQKLVNRIAELETELENL